MVKNFEDKLQDKLDNEYGFYAASKLIDEDYDYIAEKYREEIEDMYDTCEHCEEEFTSEELFSDEIGGRYYECICTGCRERYDELMEEYLDRARTELDDDWFNGNVR